MAKSANAEGAGNKRGAFRPKTGTDRKVKGSTATPVRPGPFVPRAQPEAANPPVGARLKTTLTGRAGAAPKPKRAPKPPAPGKGMRGRR